MVKRVGSNPEVTRAMYGQVAQAFGEAGVYFEEYRQADLQEPETCPEGHTAYFNAAVGAYVCRQCHPTKVKTASGWL